MNQKKKRALSFALASAVLLSQSSITVFAEEPSAPAESSKADVSQNKTTELLSLTARSERPITVSTGVSMEMTGDFEHFGVKAGDVFEGQIVIRNPLWRDISYYLETECEGDYEVEYGTENSSENLLNVKAGQNQLIDVKVTVKKPVEYGHIVFKVVGDTGLADVNSFCSETKYYRTFQNQQRETAIKISADFELAQNYSVALVDNDNKAHWYHYSSEAEDIIGENIIEVSNDILNDFQTAFVVSGNTIALVEDFETNSNSLNFSSKNNIKVAFKSNKEMSGVQVRAFTLPGSDFYILNKRIIPAEIGFEVSVPKEIGLCLTAYYPETDNNWIVYKTLNQSFDKNSDLNFEFKDFKAVKSINVDTSAFSSYNMITAANENSGVGVTVNTGELYYESDSVDAVITNRKMQVPESWEASGIEIEMQSVPNPDGDKTVLYDGIYISDLKDGDTLNLSNVYKGKLISDWFQIYSAGDSLWSYRLEDIVDAFGNKLQIWGAGKQLKTNITFTNTETGDKYITDFGWGLGTIDGNNIFFCLPGDIPNGDYDIELTVSGVSDRLWYSVDTSAEGNGIVSSGSSYASGALSGTSMSFLASAKPGSEFKYWEVSGITLTKEQITNPNLSFILPENEVALKAVFDTVVNTTTSAEAPYMIKIGDSSDGRINVSVNGKSDEGTAAEGDKIKLEAIPRSGFEFARWLIAGVELTDEQLLKSVVEFTMPAGDVSAAAEFTDAETAKYTVKVTNDGYGTAKADVEVAKAGETVTLTATPDSGYKFNKWTVVKGNIIIKDNKFTMPESDVEIKAEFAKTSSGSIGGSSGGTRRPSSSSSADESVTVNGKSGGWKDVVATIDSAANYGIITVSGNTNIPAEVIAAAAKKNIKLEVKISDAFTWVIDAAKVGESFKYLSVADEVITASNKTIKSGEASKDFRVTETKLGTGASIRYNTGASNSGKFANLFKVNGTTLEFVGVVKVDAAGSALFPITAAGVYKIVISDETKLIGDINNSMGINALDAAEMLKKLVMNEVTAEEAAKFDFNGDGKTNALDAATILKWIVKN